VSEPQGEGQPGSSSSSGSGQPADSSQPAQPASSQPTSNGQPASSGQPASNGQPRTGSPAGSSPPRSSRPAGSGPSGSRSQSSRGSDPVVDFQRWLMKAGARSMANQVADQVKRTIGQDQRRGKRDKDDVWDTATNELPPNEPLECQWCPVCQAARAARLGGPSFGARLADAGGVLASVVTDAFSAFEQVMKTQDQNRSAERTVVPPRPTPAPPSAPESGETTP
jgi:hypothetical protein